MLHVLARISEVGSSHSSPLVAVLMMAAMEAEIQILDEQEGDGEDHEGFRYDRFGLELCAICREPMAPANEQLESLPCCHKFHRDCLLTYGETREKHYLDLPCGTCKLIPSEVLSDAIGGSDHRLGEVDVDEAPPAEVDVGEVIEAPPAEVDVDEAIESVSEAQTSAVEAGSSGSQSTPDTSQSDIEERCSPCDTYCFYYPDSSEEDDNASLEKDSNAETPRERVVEYCHCCGGEIHQGLVFCSISNCGHYFGGCCMRKAGPMSIRCACHVYEPEDATANLPLPPSMPPYLTWNRQTSTAMSAQERESLATVIQDESYTVQCELRRVHIIWQHANAQTMRTKLRRIESDEGILSLIQAVVDTCPIFYESGDWAQIMQMTPDEKQDFFETAKSMTKEQKLVLGQKTKKENYTNKVDSTGARGSFFPLGWYERQGFDTARIIAKTKPEDYTEDEVLGPCYRVAISFKDSQTDRGQNQSTELQANTDSGSSSSGLTLGSVVSSESIQEMLNKKKAEVKQLIKRESSKTGELKKLTLINAAIKLSKLPPAWRSANPMAGIINDFEDLDVHDDKFDEKLASLKEQHAPMVKCIKTFT
jgi:hypothetical protein